jgi:hypothetical protein
MIIFREVTKQDRLAAKIRSELAGMFIAARKKAPYEDWDKKGWNAFEAIIDFGISEGAFMPSYTLKSWLRNAKDFFDYLPPYDILVAIYKELQKYPQGSIRGYQ